MNVPLGRQDLVMASRIQFMQSINDISLKARRYLANIIKAHPQLVCFCQKVS
jgi:hypothetical protein